VVGRDAAALERVVAQLGEHGWKGAAFTCDVTDRTAVEALPDRVTRSLGPASVLVNNAGAAASAPFARTDPDLWNTMIAANLTSTYLVTRAFRPGLLERGYGRVVNVASTAGKVGFPYVSAYCAAKHGVIGLTKALAAELATKGITVNAVCPSYVDTPMTDAAIENIVAKTNKSAEEARASLLAANPQHRLITPEEVAAAVVYLTSDAARGINGQALNLCGGALPF
jgi:NAD(P)-dependent dehydrogenase (short-subunit alcohol dehydrogenase family)